MWSLNAAPGFTKGSGLGTENSDRTHIYIPPAVYVIVAVSFILPRLKDLQSESQGGGGPWSGAAAKCSMSMWKSEGERVSRGRP